MTKQRKHKLIGLAVFILIVALIMPILFHDSNPVIKTTEVKMTANVPPEPAKPAIKLNLPNQAIPQEADLIKMTPAEQLAANRAAAGKTPEISMAVLNLHQPAANAEPAVSTDSVNVVSSDSVLKDAQAVKASPDETLLTPSFIESNTSIKAMDKSDKKDIRQNTVAPKAWVIQCGSFDNENNAANLLIKLKQNGYEAFSKQEVINDVTVTHVYVGPELDQKRLSILLNTLKTKLNLDGIIKRYDI